MISNPVIHSPPHLPREWILSKPCGVMAVRTDACQSRESTSFEFLKEDFTSRGWMENEKGKGYMHPSLFKGEKKYSLLPNLIGQNLVT